MDPMTPMKRQKPDPLRLRMLNSARVGSPFGFWGAGAGGVVVAVLSSPQAVRRRVMASRVPRMRFLMERLG